MKLYRMVDERFGSIGPYDLDTLENWKSQILDVCNLHGWYALSLHEAHDGSYVDIWTGETVLEPVDILTHEPLRVENNAE